MLIFCVCYVLRTRRGTSEEDIQHSLWLVSTRRNRGNKLIWRRKECSKKFVVAFTIKLFTLIHAVHAAFAMELSGTKTVVRVVVVVAVAVAVAVCVVNDGTYKNVNCVNSSGKNVCCFVEYPVSLENFNNNPMVISMIGRSIIALVARNESKVCATVFGKAAAFGRHGHVYWQLWGNFDL